MEQGLRLAMMLSQGDVVCLQGDLGAGKTHFTKGLARHFGVRPEHVSSPTYALVQEYMGSEVTIYHIDAYRLNSIEEALGIGLDEILDGNAIYIVEWPERISRLLPVEYWRVEIVHKGDNQRHITASRIS
jgi:tRNA threonylcarbamoyladenosine biosynthesis protein TsaE